MKNANRRYRRGKGLRPGKGVDRSPGTPRNLRKDPVKSRLLERTQRREGSA